MNRTRMLGIMNNLLLEMQEGKLLDDKGVWDISSFISHKLLPEARG